MGRIQNKKWIAFENVERVAGETKWSFIGLFLYSEGIIAFSTRPLIIDPFLVSSFLYNSIHNDMLYYLQKDIVRRSGVPLCIYFVYHFLFIGGIQLFCLGILGNIYQKHIWKQKNDLFIS